ncbi:MAG: T9SS type A sorting domain-containing protein, partial [Bacteroidota bacterium]
NPASDHVILDFGPGRVPANTTLELMTSQGTCVKRITLIGRSKTIRIGLSGLPAGYYFLRVSSDETVVVKQLVILH